MKYILIMICFLVITVGVLIARKFNLFFIDKKNKVKKLIIKVKPYAQGSNSDFWEIKYKIDNGGWNIIYNPFLNDLSISNRYHPMLFAKYDSAVIYAKGLTIEKIKEKIEDDDKLYFNHIEQLQKKHKDFISKECIIEKVSNAE